MLKHSTFLLSQGTSAYTMKITELPYIQPQWLECWGLIEGRSETDFNYCTMDFKDTGDIIVMLGETLDELGGSEYLSVVHNKMLGCPPELNILKEKSSTADMP